MKQITPKETPDLNQKLDQILLGKAIRARRTQSKLKLDETAALCGVSKQTLSNIENGHATTQIDSILQVCAGLGVQLFVKPWGVEDDDGWV